MPPRETPQPQGEPEPEMPGGGTDPSESDESDDREDGSEHPDHTDTDPYEDPASSQAEVEISPDLECIDIDDSQMRHSIHKRKKRHLHKLMHPRQQPSLPQVQHKNQLLLMKINRSNLLPMHQWVVWRLSQDQSVKCLAC